MTDHTPLQVIDSGVLSLVIPLKVFSFHFMNIRYELGQVINGILSILFGRGNFKVAVLSYIVDVNGLWRTVAGTEDKVHTVFL